MYCINLRPNEVLFLYPTRPINLQLPIDPLVFNLIFLKTSPLWTIRV